MLGAAAAAAAAAGPVWVPPEPCVRWLDDGWEGLAGGSWSQLKLIRPGSGSGPQAAAISHQLKMKLMQLQLHNAEAEQLVEAWQQLGLVQPDVTAAADVAAAADTVEMAWSDGVRDGVREVSAAAATSHSGSHLKAAQAAADGSFRVGSSLGIDNDNLISPVATQGVQESDGQHALPTAEGMATTMATAAAAAAAAVAGVCLGDLPGGPGPSSEGGWVVQEGPAGDPPGTLTAAAAAAASAASGDSNPKSMIPPPMHAAAIPGSCDGEAVDVDPAAVGGDLQHDGTTAAGAASDVDVAGGAAVAAASIAEVLRQVDHHQGGSISRRQALQLLLPVQQSACQLADGELLLYTAACLKYKVPLPRHVLVAALAAVATSPSAAVPPELVLQLLGVAAAAAALACLDGQEASGEKVEGCDDFQQQVQAALQQLLPEHLHQQQVAALSVEQLVQLLKDVQALVAGSTTSNSSTLYSTSPADSSTLYSTSPADSSTLYSSRTSAAQVTAVDVAWLSQVTSAIENKLLLIPFGSMLLQTLQLLQCLGLCQPGSSFMSNFFAAADVLLDTFSARNCLELLSASASAGQMPPQQLTVAVLQHLTPLKLTAEEASSGLRLLASLKIRPSPELLAKWFAVTESAADVLQPHLVLHVLWACCQWQLLPPSQWVHAVVKGLTAPGRLSNCSAATVAGLCLCLWQIGVHPSSGFTAAVVKAAEHGITSEPHQQQDWGGDHGSGSSSSRTNGWQMYGQQQQAPGHLGCQHWDAESLSVLCFCLSMWNVAASPSWKAAAAAHAAEVMPGADGPSLIRMGVYLSKLFAADRAGEEEELPWQQGLRHSVVRLLSHSSSAPDRQEVVPVPADSNTQNSVGPARGLPVYGLVLLYTGLMDHQPYVDVELLQLLIEAVKSAVQQEQVTMWDVLVVLPAIEELCMALAQADLAGQINGMQQLLRLQQVKFLQMDAEKLIEAACRLRDRAPAVVIQQLPLVAESLGLKIPSEVQQQLDKALAVAQAREEQLGKALMVLASGGAAIPSTLVEQLDDVLASEGAEALQHYLQNPLMAMTMSRWRRIGVDVNDSWVVKALQL
jgi:hypothetical protein